MSFLLFAITQPALQTETNIYPFRFCEKSLIATAGGIFGNNPYFCDSFAIAKLAYLPNLPLYLQSATPVAELKYLIADEDEYAVSFGAGFRYYLPLIRSGRTGATGPIDPIGPAVPKGSSRSNSLDHLYNSHPIGLTVSENSPTTFSNTELVSGTPISQSSVTTFSINQTGDYYIHFVGQTVTLSLLGGVQLYVNGVETGPNITLISGEAPLILQQIINISSAPATLQIRGTGLVLTLGENATIRIVELSTPLI